MKKNWKEISQLINKSLLEGSGGELACPNCENVCEIFCHIYDEDKCGLSCSNCRYEEWVSEGGSGPRVCQVCDEYVTEEDEKKDNVVTCSAVDPEGRST